MGKYSAKDSPAFDALVDSHLEHIADAVYSSIYAKHWKALVLFGEYGRGEGVPLAGANGEERPFGEYSLAVITRSPDPLIKRSLQNMSAHLSEELGLPVTLAPLLERSLKKCEFSLSNYEMEQGHRVVRGDQNILSKMPEFPLNRIPLSEGPRLLLNRGKLLLDMRCRLGTGKPLMREEHRRFIQIILKANLAFGDCALLLRGAYDPSFAVKKSRIDQIDLSGLGDAEGLAGAYRKAIHCMEHADFQPLETENLHVWLDETVGRFGDVFLWYERRRLNRSFRTPKKYAHAFPHLGTEGSRLKNAAHNLRTFGPLAPSVLCSHPRLRLYAALSLLLLSPSDRGEIRWILRSNQSTFEGLCEVFTSLYEKFS